MASSKGSANGNLRQNDTPGGRASPFPGSSVVPAHLVESGFCGKAWHDHFANSFRVPGSTVEVRRQFGDKERELLSHIHTYKGLLGESSVADNEREGDIDNPAHAAEG